MDKAALRQAIVTELESQLRLITEAANTARDEATDEESRAEDRYDMRSQSAAYLAEGQARMAGETADAITAFRNLSLKSFAPTDPIASSALLTLEAGVRKNFFFMGPAKGGLEVKVGGKTVTVVTSASPLGLKLMGRKVGDTVELPGVAKPVVHKIVALE